MAQLIALAAKRSPPSGNLLSRNDRIAPRTGETGRDMNQATPQRLRMGVIGVGIRGQHAWSAILTRDPRVDAVLVCQDPAATPALLEGASAADLGAFADGLGATLTDDLDELIAHPALDLICLTCEPGRALELGRRCLEAGKHVLRDKPPTRTAAEAWALQQAADAANRQCLMVAPLRYQRPIADAKAQVEAGALGKLLAVTMSWVWPSGPLEGFRPTREFRDAYGGGDVVIAGFHAVDMLNWLIDARPREVFAEVGSFFYDNYQALGLDDLGHLVITYDNGVIATLITGRVPRRSGEHAWLELTAEAGALELRHLHEGFEIHSPAGTQQVSYATDANGRMARDYVDRLLTDRPAPSDLRDGAAALAVLEAAYRSAASHRVEPVELPSEACA